MMDLDFSDCFKGEEGLSYCSNIEINVSKIALSVLVCRGINYVEQ